jgi:tRNA G10  N-methylase Trm11
MTDHPATFTDALLPIMAGLLPPGPAMILDPFAGTGKIARLRQWLPEARFFGYEIEHEWADQARTAGCRCITGDSRHMVYGRDTFDAICTSATYGNRMADHHEAREYCRLCSGTGQCCLFHDMAPTDPRHARYPDCHHTAPCPRCKGIGHNNYVRHDYRHALGRPLTPGNSGGMQWGEEYRELHRAVYRECRRVLKPGGIFVLNMKDHIRKGVLQEVTKWHYFALLDLGLVCTARVHVPCPGQRHGANGHLRVEYESVLQFRRDR